ncbi:putative bap28 [Danaus plexippus plexippus]|uniref:HEAT repeat-containing protein 1 n=1 Tax=Danaus plexippus plexippus TaxID=278856 RepID=A0A212F6R4_DANPL|nr:putative bap28 [Danaus plexippus plexippus]
MASTSLVEQLQKLSVPQSSVYKDDRRKASLLFDPKEAALKDRDTFYEIGLSGLKELIALYEGFRVYEDSLYSIASKDFNRAVESKEVNQNLNQTIEKFLLQLSPYFLLQSTHKALEWLVNRYHIHEYNQEAIMVLILPYHETKIFIRFVQILDIKPNSRWNWLEPIQKKGIPLTKQVLHNQCVSNTATLQFIAKTTSNFVTEFGERATQLSTVFAFFCSTAIGAINTAKYVTESIVNALLPTIVKGLDSTIADFRSSAYVVLGYLCTKATLKKKTLNELTVRLLTSEYDLSYDAILLINLIYTNQKHLTKMPLEVLSNISVDVMNDICKHLKKLVELKINIQAFSLAFLSSVLNIVQKDIENFRLYCQLPEIFVDEVDHKNQQPEKIVRCILSSLHASKDSNNGDESDIEIIDEDDAFSNKITSWYSQFLKNIENKYPDVFDKVIKKEMSSESKISIQKRVQLSKVLGFKPAVAHKVGGTYLFENLNHINPEMRVEAVNYIAKEFEFLKIENLDFVKDSILSRLEDDDIDVVDAALDISSEHLKEILNENDLAKTFVRIVTKDSKKWRPVITKAILKFCSIDTFPINQEIVLAIFPYLFSNETESAEITYKILSSSWGRRFGFEEKVSKINQSMSDNYELLNQIIFGMFFVDRSINVGGILDINLLNKDNTLDMYVFILLKFCSPNGVSVQDSMDILNLILKSVETRAIVSTVESSSFASDSMTEFMKLARKDKIVFEVLLYIFSRIIEQLDQKSVTTPWCNILETPERILIKQLYEILITGCGISLYGKHYAGLLQKLLEKLFKTPNERFDFIANIACGHILYAVDPKDVISPELQLRSLKLMTNFVSHQNDFTWICDSDAFILCILLDLNHSVLSIRKCTIDLIQKLLNKNNAEKNIYVELLTALMSHSEELLLDNEQLPQALKTILSQPFGGHKVFRRNCLLKLSGILNGDAPSHVRYSLIRVLSSINNTATFTLILPALNGLEELIKQNELDKKFTFDIYDSSLISSVYSKINKITATTFDQENVWKSIEIGLKEYRECILNIDQTFVSPCVMMLKQINEEVFSKVPDERKTQLIHLITFAGTFSNNPNISSAASKVMKKIHLNFKDFKPILDGMLNAADPAGNVSKKKKATVSMLSYQLSETDEWRLGVTILEYVQNKKKMTVDNSFISLLFQILNKCLRFEEQSYVEYTKQLILSSLWYFCKKFGSETDKEELKMLKGLFDIELVVQCIRGTQNPQTQHHALILLSHAAYMLPEQVLHHTMEIFTFMGSSVLRHDDAYSFQIITKIIETLIPILVKLDKNVDEYTEKEIQQLQKRVVPVLRIFADVVLHVPEHRRLPLYKKLIETLGPNQFLWVFLALLLETHITHFSDSKKPDKAPPRNLAEQESPVNRMDFGQNILLEFPPEVGLENFIKLTIYMKSLPLQKDENAMESDIDPSEIFSVNGHTPIQLRHYKYVIVTFMNTCLSSSRFIHHNSLATDIRVMESHYKTYIINILTFIQSVSKIGDENPAKYWRVMLHHSYDLLDHTINLLSAPMFLSVVRGLLKHTLKTVRRKSMELLNSKIQFSPEMFNDVDKELVFSLLPALLDIVKTIGNHDTNLDEMDAQELELNQQTALLSLKLLARMLAAENREPFKPVLETVTDYTCDASIPGNVMASIVLCLAELCSNLKAHALGSLRKFMPALIKVLKKQRKSETPELVLLSTVTAISKIVESLPLFLSPYLQKILYEYAILLAKWQEQDQECSKVSAVVSKLVNIKKKIAGSIPPRVLIPVTNETHQIILEKENYSAVGPVMSILADSFANVTTADFNALQQDLTSFFLTALQLRSDASNKKVDANIIDSAEDEVVKALVSLVLKLSETSFRPFYFKIYDWAIRTNIEGHKDRSITFYRLSSAIADRLKGLFVLFAGHFVKNAADLLDACNNSKTEELYFESEEKDILLINYIIKTLHIVFLYDNQSFLNKDRFETLMQPVVDQLENTVGGITSFKTRATELIIPCISQFAVATADDSLWKLLNYQVLLKTRHNDAEIRLIGLDCLVAMATQLGSNWLPLLAESVPFLAELLEDGDQRIESATKNAVRTLEQILGEPLENYF